MHIVWVKLAQADAGDNEAKLMTKLAPEWVRTSDPVIRSPAHYRWTTAPAATWIEGSIPACRVECVRTNNDVEG